MVIAPCGVGRKRSGRQGRGCFGTEAEPAGAGAGVKEGGAAAADGLARDGAAAKRRRLTRGRERPLTQEAGHHGTWSKPPAPPGGGTKKTAGSTGRSANGATDRGRRPAPAGAGAGAGADPERSHLVTIAGDAGGASRRSGRAGVSLASCSMRWPATGALRRA